MKKIYTIKVSAMEHCRINGEIQIEASDEAEAVMQAVMKRDMINWDYRTNGAINQYRYEIEE